MTASVLVVGQNDPQSMLDHKDKTSGDSHVTRFGRISLGSKILQ